MSRRVKLILVSLAALFLIVALFTDFLLDDGAAPEDKPYSVDLDEVRLLATAAPGDLPLRINGILVAENQFPRLGVIAGTLDTTPTSIAHVAYQVVYADSTVIIDTGMDRELNETMQEGSPYFPENYERLQHAMRVASAIAIPHEHVDHIGGVVRSPYLDEIAPKTILTPEQLDGITVRPLMPDLTLSAADAARFRPVDYTGYYPLAPGIVLIKASGHTPGTQMIYVRLEDSAEYLFVGDVAWSMDNIFTLTSRPRLVASFMLDEDSAAVVGQLAWLNKLHNEGELILVVSHDLGQFQEQIVEGILGGDFQIGAANGPPE